MKVERLPKTPLWLALFAVGANGLSTIAGDTLFVSTFSLGELSRFVGVSAVVRVLASFAYAALMTRMLGSDPGARSSSRFDAAVIAATAALLVASALMAGATDRGAVLAVCIAQLVLPPLLPLIAFNATTSTLEARHAKRVLPLVAGAATVGSIAVGALASVLAKTLGVSWILAGAALLSLASLPLVLRLGEVAPDQPKASRAGASVEPRVLASLREAIGDLGNTPAVRVVVAFTFFGAMATTFVDFAFKAALKESFAREEMAFALGVFGVVSNSLVLVLQLLVTGPLVARLGVGRTLAFGPMLLGAAGLLAFALPAVVGTGLARVAEIIVRYGVGNSVADVLIVPLARAVRVRAKVLVKGAASPLGALLASGILVGFGPEGPPRHVQLTLLALACALVIGFVRGAPAAYASALSQALTRGRSSDDISPEAALVFKSTVRHELEVAVLAGAREDALRTLDLMSDRFFEPRDLERVIASKDPVIRRAAAEKAARLSGGQRGDELLRVVPADLDPEIETLVLTAAREAKVLADDARLARAIEIGRSTPDSEPHARLWAEALLQDATRGVRERDAGARAEGQARLDRALKQLRKAARDASSRERAAALWAIGELGDRRAEREVLSAASSLDARVFREAARAAILLDAGGAVTSLVSRLVSGPHAGVAARALALAGPRAVRELVHALPVTRGEGSIAPTAVADVRTVSGTVRAARALARIGEEALREVLPMFGQLGHRARTAVAQAFAARDLVLGAAERALVEEAVTKLVDYGKLLLAAHASAPNGLYAHELSRRIEDNVVAIFDLTSALGDRTVMQRARFAVMGQGAGRSNALELLETVLSAPLGADSAAFVAHATQDASGAPASGPAPVLDGWLEKCRKYDARELPSGDPMLGVLDKVLLLREVPLFRGLSGEELYPVAEIATIEGIAEGTAIVREGDPSDDLYVVVEGTLGVLKGGTRVAAIEAGKAFGELGVLDGEPRTATVTAESECRLLRIPRSELEALLDESPEVARGIIRTLLSYVRSKDGPAAPASK